MVSQEVPRMAPGLLLAFVLGVLLAPVIRLVLLRMIGIGDSDGQLYGLDQARLNIDIPPRSMWMNLGYWGRPSDPTNQSDREQLSHFPTACRRLLEQVLTFAGFTVHTPLQGQSVPRITPPMLNQPLFIIDVGFGCGDQTRYLLDAVLPASHGNVGHDRPLVDHYAGITIDETQYSYALDSVLSTRRHDAQHARLFRADAAKPDSWPQDLRSISSSALKGAQTWILALDTLYHFSPSRVPLLKHAAQDLHANVMAFDLLLSPSATFFQRAILRLICPFLGAPYGGLMESHAYRTMLADAGFLLDDVRIADISEKVFPGLASFLEERDLALKQHSFGGLGKLRAAKWLFGWWARSGVVRGCLVVARAAGPRTKTE